MYYSLKPQANLRASSVCNRISELMNIKRKSYKKTMAPSDNPAKAMNAWRTTDSLIRTGSEAVLVPAADDVAAEEPDPVEDAADAEAEDVPPV